MFKTIIDAFKIKEIRNKIFMILFILLIYRIGCWLPAPGLNLETFADNISDQTFLSLVSSINGGALANGAILALGVTPYIMSSIIIQLLTLAIPSLEKLKKMGDEGRKKIATYTKYTALVLAIVQAVGLIIGFSGSLNASLFGFVAPVWVVGALVCVILVAGAMFTYWLGEKITSIGIGNGVSLLIFVGILSSAGASILYTITNIGGDISNLWDLIIFAIALILIFGFIVYIDLAERKVPVQYAKQIKGRKMYGGQSTHIPIRINATGVMPIILAMAILSFPQLIMSIFWPTSDLSFYEQFFGVGSWFSIILIGLLILFFSYFWAQTQFNPEDVSRNIQQNGGFIPGIRPGKPTAEYLKKISNRIVLFGALFLSFIAIIPNMLFKSIGSTSGLVNAFSATALLIIVSVALEFNKQLEAQMLMRNYKGFLK